MQQQNLRLINQSEIVLNILLIDLPISAFGQNNCILARIIDRNEGHSRELVLGQNAARIHTVFFQSGDKLFCIGILSDRSKHRNLAACQRGCNSLIGALAPAHIFRSQPLNGLASFRKLLYTANNIHIDTSDYQHI
ncbi:hypothetical protein D3C78_1491040 [compost metagenome]